VRAADAAKIDPRITFGGNGDPIEAAVREQVRGFIAAMMEYELEGTLQRPR
jgi:hypothetical protein